MGEFLNALYEADDLLEIRFMPSKRRLFAKASDLSQQIDRLRKESAQGQHVFVSANPRRRRGGKKEDVALARSVFADLEDINGAAAVELIKAKSLPAPTLTLNSGHGVHVYWRLAQPLDDLEAWTEAQKQLALRISGDSKVCDPPRMMRLPGFMNYKAPSALCTLIDADPQRRYRLEDLLQQSQPRERSEPSIGSNRETDAINQGLASIVSDDSVVSVDSVTLLQESKTAIDAAIRRTTPKEPGLRNKSIFEFARSLKAIAGIADLPASDLKPVMRRWHQAALPFIKTQPFDETWADFVASWRNVRFALGESPLDQIAEAIKTRQPPPQCAEYDSPKVKLLVALCAELQRIAGDKDFYLDCRAAGRVLAADPVSVWRWLKMLRADRLLLEKETGRPGRCTRWRWVPRE